MKRGEVGRLRDNALFEYCERARALARVRSFAIARDGRCSRSRGIKKRGAWKEGTPGMMMRERRLSDN